VIEAIDPDPRDVDDQLAELDLRVEDLVAAVRAGIAARRTATLNHPSAYGGWRDYGERTAALREVHATRGWTSQETRGVCLTVHPDGRLALMSAIGNAATGTAAEGLTTLRRRGEATKPVVAANAQMEFELDDIEGEAAKPWTSGSMPTWVLLVHTEGDEVRSELALARHMDEDGYIDDWIRRIPLPIIRLNDMLTEEPIADDERGAEGPEFDVPEL
jgi:hypothetical protein